MTWLTDLVDTRCYDALSRHLTREGLKLLEPPRVGFSCNSLLYRFPRRGEVIMRTFEMFIAATALLAGAAAVSVWFSRPHNAKECLLAEMRGQPDIMRQVAIRLCGDRFPNDALY